jgi:hypothetical protein
MANSLDKLLIDIGNEYREQISGNSRHYLEVSIGKTSEKLGYQDLQQQFQNVYAIVPLKHPIKGMKVRIDGRTFKNYSQFESGIAVPGYIAEQSKLPFTVYTPQQSMILNC